MYLYMYRVHVPSVCSTLSVVRYCKAVRIKIQAQILYLYTYMYNSGLWVLGQDTN